MNYFNSLIVLINMSRYNLKNPLIEEYFILVIFFKKTGQDKMIIIINYLKAL